MPWVNRLNIEQLAEEWFAEDWYCVSSSET